MSHLSNSGEDALVARLACDGAKHCIPYSDADVPSVYCTDRCVAWVNRECFMKSIYNSSSSRADITTGELVWLQFPQDCCRDAPLVLMHMQEQLPGRELVIIFNSSANKCCVNLKNAGCRNGEGLIHFGRSCGVCPIPRLRVPTPQWLTDTDRVCEAVLASQCSESQLAEDNKRVVILYDMRCALAMGAVYEKLRVSLPGLVMSRRLSQAPAEVDGNLALASSANTSDTTQNDLAGFKSEDLIEPRKTIHVNEESKSRSLTCTDPCDTSSSSNFGKPGFDRHCTCPSDYSLSVCKSCAFSVSRNPKRLDDLPESSAERTNNGNEDFYVVINDIIFKLPGTVVRSDISFVYIGRKGPTLTSLSLKLASFAVCVVDPVSGETFPSAAQKMIMQRNYKIEQIRDAQKIGLLISNFNVSACSEIVTRLASFIKRSGKKLFLQYSAHPDLPKLMNVPGVDVFVHIACAESTVVEREVDPDLYKVMVTPWELEVALNPHREWSLNFETNFNELLSSAESHLHDSDSDVNITSADEYSVSVSLLSNRTQALGIAPSLEVSSQALNGETGAMVADHCRQVAQRLEAGRHLGLLKGEMPWYGLDPKTEAPTEIGTVIEGRKGVAGGYSQEGSC